jgi:RNA polymerase sigma-70 factor (ECF subfamily)
MSLFERPIRRICTMPKFEDQNDSDLLSLIRDESQAVVAFSALYDRYFERLFIHCAKFLGNAAEAEDILQSLWMRVWETRGYIIDIDEGNVKGFLFTTARHKCLDLLKSSAKAKSGSIDLVIDREAASADYATKELVLMAIDALPIKLREVFILNEYDGFTLEEISNLLGASLNAVKKRSERAKKILRETVSKLLEINVHE